MSQAQPERERPRLPAGEAREKASVTIKPDLLLWLDAQAFEADRSRSRVVERIIEEAKKRDDLFPGSLQAMIHSE